MIPVIVGMAIVNMICCRSTDSIAGVSTPPVEPLAPGAAAPGAPFDTTLPHVRAGDFIWGVNGHPLHAGAYERASEPERQFEYLDQLGVTYYRINVPVDTVRGDVRSRGIPFGGLLDVADRHHIYILPVIDSRPRLALPPGARSIAMNVQAGYNLGYTFAAKYGSRISYIEAGNELDAVAQRAGTEGSILSQYDSVKLAFTTAFLRGMTRGIRAAAPHIKIIVDASWRHYAFFEALNRDSVDYDVVGCHWYSEMGDVTAPIHGGTNALQHFAAFDKPVWVTEINRRNGSYQEASPDDEAHWIGRFAREAYGSDQVKAFFVYELYDEFPAVAGGEGYYGLVTCLSSAAGCTGAPTPKPGFDAYRFVIEEQTSGYTDYVYHIFAQFVRRRPTEAELTTWTNRLVEFGRERRANKPQFIKTFLPQRDSGFLADRFQQVLQRPPTAGELATWTSQLSSGISRYDVTASLCASDEFWTISGGTNTGFVNHLYERLLTRAPSPAELTSAVRRITDGESRQELVASILDGDEFHGLVIDRAYRDLLGRAATPLERATDVGRMRAGLTEEGLVIWLLDSREFWTNAIHAGLQHRARPLDQSGDHTID